MNKIQIQHKKITFLCFTTLIFLANLKSVGRSGSFGNTFIFSGAEIGIVSIQHNFQNEGSGVLAGPGGTERATEQGYLSFLGNALWKITANNAHVHNYLKTYMTIPLTFPIVNITEYRPAVISVASMVNPANVAYFDVGASTTITSSLKRGNEPVLPTAELFSTTSKDVSISAVSNVEYWDINGASSAKITLTWDANSAVGTLTSNTLSKLSIVGWDGTKWVKIPSKVDATSLLGGSSSLTSGSITTDATLIPNSYNVYTLGSATVTAACVIGSAGPSLKN